MLTIGVTPGGQGSSSSLIYCPDRSLVLQHLSYYPGLAPSDFYHLPAMKLFQTKSDPQVMRDSFLKSKRGFMHNLLSSTVEVCIIA